jgi:hypothetical protein
MTRPIDPLFDERVAEWLHGDPDRAPGDALEMVLTTFPSVPQQRFVHRMPRRFPTMSMPTRVAAAVGVAVVALAGALAIGRPSPTPSVDPSPSLPGVVAPSPTASATAPNPSAFPRSTGVWIATGTMGTPRRGHTAVRLLDGRVLVAGGYPGDEPDDAVTSAELYDPESGTWSATGNMLRPHAGFAATLLRDGKVLVGDVDDPAADSPIFGAEVYDPSSGTWTVTGKMVTPHIGSAMLLRDGRVLVVHEFGSSELYDPVSGTWTTTGQMLEYFHQSRAMVLMPDGKVLEVGGNNGMGYVGVAAELYDPDTGIWTAIANMNSPMEVVSATLLRDGRVLVMDRGFITLKSPELYDPATGTWTATGEMARPGAKYGSATLLSDGLVLVADDYGAELYDPDIGSWTTTGYMLRGHASALTLLLDGTVLVAGGQDCLDGVCVATGSAELYVPRGVSPPPLPAFPSPPPPVFPNPTPVPTPVPPMAGPVPPGGRSWKVTVVNKSSEPATLFVAEENKKGLLGSLIGSVTPNVVPPGATVRVTFLLPAKGVEGWSIFVNPGPNDGPLIVGPDLPLAGQIHINEDGQPSAG